MKRPFESARSKYFDPLCDDLDLERIAERINGDLCVVSASGGNCSVFLECERGLCLFYVGKVGASRPFCDLNTYSERLPRVRAMAGGTQRLSLQEQADLIRRHWDQLQADFSDSELRETERWLQQVQAELTEKYSGS